MCYVFIFFWFSSFSCLERRFFWVQITTRRSKTMSGHLIATLFSFLQCLRPPMNGGAFALSTSLFFFFDFFFAYMRCVRRHCFAFFFLFSLCNVSCVVPPSNTLPPLSPPKKKNPFPSSKRTAWSSDDNDRHVYQFFKEKKIKKNIRGETTLQTFFFFFFFFLKTWLY